MSHTHRPGLRRRIAFVLATAALLLVLPFGRARLGGAAAAAPRPLVLEHGDHWLGEGIAYGPHRDGQRPGGPSPSRQQIVEDLRILARHWRTIRVYGSAELGETILSAIRRERLGLQVMLGAWIAAEETPPDSLGRVTRHPELRAENQHEIEAAIRLANAYPDVVASVCVGNETQVFWSDHRCSPEALIGWLREVRAATRVPVTTADDFNFWNKPESDRIARECDFIVVHAHPLWNGQQLADALGWTRAVVRDARRRHPDRLVVLGETGWATRRADFGDQAKLMKGRLGEREQARFYREFHQWIRDERQPAFFFEAFDENWKGGDDPDEVEKHWGLFRADRTPKEAMVEAAQDERR